MMETKLGLKGIVIIFWRRVIIKSHSQPNFEDNFVNFLNKYAPKKIKIFRDNHKPYVSMTLRLTIMKRFQLKISN